MRIDLTKRVCKNVNYIGICRIEPTCGVLLCTDSIKAEQILSS